MKCEAGKHEVEFVHPYLPCEACISEEAAAARRVVTLPAEDITQVQYALRAAREFLELVRAPLVGSEEHQYLPVSKVIAEAEAAEQVLQDALVGSLKQQP